MNITQLRKLKEVKATRHDANFISNEEKQQMVANEVKRLGGKILSQNKNGACMSYEIMLPNPKELGYYLPKNSATNEAINKTVERAKKSGL